MRRRLLASTLTIVVAILVLFGVPLGVVLDRAVHADAQSRLDREATRVAREVGRDPHEAARATAAELARLVAVGRPRPRDLSRPHRRIRRSAGARAPGRDRRPAPTDPRSASRPPPTRSTRASNARLLALVVLGIVALFAALGLALIQSRRLADPLARLARSATRLGEGDFSLSSPRSGVPEIDEIATSLDRSAARIEELLRSERSFSEHASHQLRTALTGLQLRIEELAGNRDPAVREEAEAALEQSTRLTSIIEELLALARTGRAGIVRDFDLGDLVRQHVDDIEPVLARAWPARES